jgi:hypothetical protein
MPTTSLQYYAVALDDDSDILLDDSDHGFGSLAERTHLHSTAIYCNALSAAVHTINLKKII